MNYELPAGLATEVGFGVKSPCDDCPFRSDRTPYYFGLLKDDFSSQLFQVAEGSRGFTCHRTDPRSDHAGAADSKQVHHCAGALIFQQTLGVDSWFTRRARKLGVVMSRRVPVYRTIMELVLAYAEEAKRRRIERRKRRRDRSVKSG